MSHEKKIYSKPELRDIGQDEFKRDREGIIVDHHRGELREFADKHKLRPLEDRVNRGLDPIGIVALKETSKKVQEICDKTQIPYEEVLKVVFDIQNTGPWEYARKFKEGDDPATRLWVMLNAANLMDKGREYELTSSEFLEDLKRIERHLDEAIDNPDAFYEKAHEYVIDESKKYFRLEDGVPVSEIDNGYIHMALNGYEAGVIQDADGILMVGSKDDIDVEQMLRWGLTIEERDEAKRGRKKVTYFVNKSGEAVAKLLYPGFLIVLSRNFELAKAIVKGSTEVDPEILGQMVYKPTSASDEAPEFAKIKRSHRVTEAGVEEEESLKDRFFRKFSYLKASQIFRDRAIAAIRKLKAKDKGRVTNDSLETYAAKTREKVEQKMQELRYMAAVMDDAVLELPPEVTNIIDMAGGAGDLGLAVAVEMRELGKDVNEIRIVDPMEELRHFNKAIVSELPESEWFQERMNYQVATLQEAKVSKDSIVVAKHPCGDLTDSIIEQWVDSESPLLVIMTCCQEKAKDQPARYGLSQDDWGRLCKLSAKTNSLKSAQREEGMKAMTELDEARVRYLKRHDIDAELVQTDKFPKGDVIIARRKAR